MKLYLKVNTILMLLFVVLIFWGCGNRDNSPQTAEKEVIEAPKLDLHAAIYMRDMEAIQQHIKIGTDINSLEPSRKSTPLITAAALGEPEAAKLLIDAGADLNYKNLDGSTALHTAVVFGKTKVANVLIDAGADLNLQSLDGSTALHTSAFFCREEIVKALLQKGAEKSILNNYGKTALNNVELPFEEVKGIYDAVGEGLKPFGVEFDYEQLKAARPIIAKMLK